MLRVPFACIYLCELITQGTLHAITGNPPHCGRDSTLTGTRGSPPDLLGFHPFSGLQPNCLPFPGGLWGSPPTLFIYAWVCSPQAPLSCRVQQPRQHAIPPASALHIFMRCTVAQQLPLPQCNRLRRLPCSLWSAICCNAQCIRTLLSITCSSRGKI